MSPLMICPPGQDHKPNSILYEGKENQERLEEKGTTLRRQPDGLLLVRSYRTANSSLKMAHFLVGVNILV
jgi:hypothetical protein